MSELSLCANECGSLDVDGDVNRLSLYEQYGSIAYGLILQFLPQPYHAQEILADLFASLALQVNMPALARTITRLAREKALGYRQRQDLPIYSPPESADQPGQVVNLLFYQNQPHGSTSGQLQVQRSAIPRFIWEFFDLLPS